MLIRIMYHTMVTCSIGDQPGRATVVRVGHTQSSNLEIHFMDLSQAKDFPSGRGIHVLLQNCVLARAIREGRRMSPCIVLSFRWVLVMVCIQIHFFTPC